MENKYGSEAEGDVMNKEKKVVETLNKMLECSEPIYYDDFNKFIVSNNKEKLEAYEKENPKLGIATFKTENENGGYIYDNDTIGISTLSIIATITDIFCDKRLGAIVETGSENRGKIIKFDLEQKRTE